MPVSYPYVRRNNAKNERIKFYGISERKEQYNNTAKAYVSPAIIFREPH